MFGGGRRRLSRALRRRDARTRVSPEAVSPPSPAPNGGELVDFGGSKDSVRGGNSDSPTFLHAAALPASFSRRKNEGSR